MLQYELRGLIWHDTTDLLRKAYEMNCKKGRVHGCTVQYVVGGAGYRRI